MKNKLISIILVIIVSLGIIVRFYNLGTVPGSLEWDEVSIGYNAYSILQTGKDEYGKILPFAFQAFGEYKQPVYIYLDVISQALFGLNAFAVRFPAALFGVVSILSVFFLTKELFYKQKSSALLSLLAAFFFAISPWSIQFSRAAYEANISLFFVITGVWVFLRGVRTKKNYYLFLATIFFIVSIYSYLGQKFFVPVIFIALFFYAKEYFLKQKKIAVLLIIFFFLGNLFWIGDLKSISRSQAVLVTNQQAEILKESLPQLHYDQEHKDLFGTVIHNRRIVYAQTVAANYLSHFDPVFLFISGDSVPRHHAPSMGMLYLLSLPFILLGFYFLLRNVSRGVILLFVWLLLAPVTASLTYEAPHALRSLNFLPTWQIIEAAGVIYALQLLKGFRFKQIVIFLYAISYILSFAYFVHQYFVHINTTFQKGWQFGYKEAIDYLSSDTSGGKYVFANDFEQPYIFYLFHTAYSPEKYLASGGSSIKAADCYTINKASFGNCKNTLREGDYYIALSEVKEAKYKEMKRFLYADGSPASIIYKYEK